jgi:hypothetical protein
MGGVIVSISSLKTLPILLYQRGIISVFDVGIEAAIRHWREGTKPLSMRFIHIKPESQLGGRYQTAELSVQ